MDHSLFLTIGGSLVSLMLLIIGIFLKRLLHQFDQLLEKFDQLNTTMLEHKADVEVIKEQVHTHARDINSINSLYDRVRHIESEMTGIRVRVGM